jgi:hypothetical protein
MIHEKVDDLRQFFSNMSPTYFYLNYDSKLKVNFHKSCQIRHKFFNGQILNLKNVCISGWWDSFHVFMFWWNQNLLFVSLRNYKHNLFFHLYLQAIAITR